MFDINKLKNVIVSFKLNFPFDVKDSVEKENDGEPYLIGIDGIPAQLRTKRNYNVGQTLNGINFAPYSKIEQDRYGIMSKTEIQMWFDKQTFESDKIDKTQIGLMPHQFFELTILYLNKYITDYRRITKQFWIPYVGENDVISYTYTLLDSNKETAHILVPIQQTVQFNGGAEFSLDSEQEAKLRVHLQNDFDYLQDDLRLSIADNFEQAHYNIAIIQCAILFENWVYTQLKKSLSRTKLNKMKKKDVCGCMTGIYEVCTSGLAEEYAFNFGETDEFKSFHNNVLKLRNDIVHGELLTNISREQCNTAINDTTTAIEYLSNNWHN